MLEKLKKVEEKFDFISAELCKSEVVSDMELYKKYMQELKHLSPIVEKYRDYQAAENNAEEALGRLAVSGAPAKRRRACRHTHGDCLRSCGERARRKRRQKHICRQRPPAG